MIYEIRHRTEFHYAQRVSISQHALRLAPRPHPRQTRLAWDIAVTPAPSIRADGTDYFGNPQTFMTVDAPHDALIVEARGRVSAPSTQAPALANDASWEAVAEALAKPADIDAFEACQYAFASPHVALGPEIRAYGLKSFTPGRPLAEAARELTARVFKEFEYKGGVTDIQTPVDEVLASRKGVCQDFAHLQIAALRSLGLAARYVSGYLMTHPPEGEEKLIGADASHAWIAVWSPVLGWIDLDPTNDLICDDEHVTLAWGRDYGDVSPINGFMVGGGAHDVEVSVDVRPAKGPWEDQDLVGSKNGKASSVRRPEVTA